MAQLLTTSMTLILVILYQLCDISTQYQANDPKSPSGHNATQNLTAVTEVPSPTSSRQGNDIVTVLPKPLNHHHVSAAIIGIAASAVIIALLIAWCIYARQFPTSNSGQCLVRIKYVLQKGNPETHAYRSVNGPV